MSDIDVVIITYNRRELLSELVNMLLNQTIRPGIIVADDGSDDGPLSQQSWLKGSIWHRHEGYQRVAMANAGLALVTAPYVILMDDDQIPLETRFIETYLIQLREHAVVRGLGLTDRYTCEPVPFFSTANLGMSTMLLRSIGGIDMRYNGHYGMEDRDLGRKLRHLHITPEEGWPQTCAHHKGIAYGVTNPTVDRSYNEQVYITKWGDLNG